MCRLLMTNKSRNVKTLKIYPKVERVCSFYFNFSVDFVMVDFLLDNYLIHFNKMYFS